jgi:serine/threonine protein kinase
MKLKTIQSKHDILLKEIQKHFQASSNSIHKARNEIKIIKHDKQELVIKSFKVPHLLNKIIYSFFRDSKAKKSYENSVKIIDFVPKPIGYVEFQKFGLIHDSYFVSENFNYDFTIREPLLNEIFEDKERIFKEFAYFTQQLHKHNIYHLDYSPGNILIKKENGQFIFKIVDINRMQFKALDLETRLKNFAKLWAKDEDLEVIVREYAKLVNEDETYCLQKALEFSQAHKDKKNFKKRLKGIKVVD